jgi:hypothetical protein
MLGADHRRFSPYSHSWEAVATVGYSSSIPDLEQTDGVPVRVTGGRATPSGRPPRGLKLGDVIKFGEG